MPPLTSAEEKRRVKLTKLCAALEEARAPGVGPSDAEIVRRAELIELNSKHMNALLDANK